MPYLMHYLLDIALGKRRFMPQISSILRTPWQDRLIIQTSLMESRWTTNSFDFLIVTLLNWYMANIYKNDHFHHCKVYTSLALGNRTMLCNHPQSLVLSSFLFPVRIFVSFLSSQFLQFYSMCGEMITFHSFINGWVQGELPSLDETLRLCSLPEGASVFCLGEEQWAEHLVNRQIDWYTSMLFTESFQYFSLQQCDRITYL